MANGPSEPFVLHTAAYSVSNYERMYEKYMRQFLWLKLRIFKFEEYVCLRGAERQKMSERLICSENERTCVPVNNQSCSRFPCAPRWVSTIEYSMLHAGRSDLASAAHRERLLTEGSRAVLYVLMLCLRGCKSIFFNPFCNQKSPD